MHNYIEWGGVSSDSLSFDNFIITALPSLSRPARKYDTYDIPGRSGPVLIAQDAWENIEVTYELTVTGDGASDAGRILSEWLSAASESDDEKLCSNGYMSLKDSFEPKFERRAYLVDGYDIENKMNKHGSASITFSCRAERFLRNGFQKKTFTESGTIINPTKFNSKPCIVIKGTKGSLTINNQVVTIADMTDVGGSLTIDSESMNAYSSDGTNANDLITLDEFPKLISGKNTIELGEGLTEVAIMPRWWTL